MKRIELEDRQAECACADEAIAQALLKIELEGRRPDGWEDDLLTGAIGARLRGNYRLAESYARNAMTPIGDRSRQAKLSTGKYDLSMLKEAFRVACEEPIRPYPHFGPIIFVGGERATEA